MDTPLAIPRPLRYDGAERRRSYATYHGVERRVLDPATEQDHPELYEPDPAELQLPG